MRYDTVVGPLGKIYSVSHDDGQEGTRFAELADVVKRAGKTPKDARAELMRLIEQIPDEDLTNFIGAQVSVVS
jgi:hypothetical protein